MQYRATVAHSKESVLWSPPAQIRATVAQPGTAQIVIERKPGTTRKVPWSLFPQGYPRSNVKLCLRKNAVCLIVGAVAFFYI